MAAHLGTTYTAVENSHTGSGPSTVAVDEMMGIVTEVGLVHSVGLQPVAVREMVPKGPVGHVTPMESGVSCVNGSG